MRRNPTLVLTALALSVLACTKVTEMQPMTAQPAPVFMPPGQIAGIVFTANNGDIELAELAVAEATNDRVREFAQNLVTDHTDANERLSALLAEENWTSTSSETAMSLEEEAEEHLEMLRGMEGAAFDEHFMEIQIQMHNQLLERFDQILIRAAEDDDMEAYLRNLRAGVAAHLVMAEDILDDLEG